MPTAWSNRTAPGGSATARSTASSPIEVGELATERARVVRGADLHVIVEIDIDVARPAGGTRVGVDQLGVIRLAAGAPGADARRPAIERIVGIAAGVKLLGAVQAQV